MSDNFSRMHGGGSFFIYLQIPVVLSLGMLLLGYSPDHLSAAFVAVMVLVIVFATIVGVLPMISLMHGFYTGAYSAEQISQTDSKESWWMQIRRDDFFRQKTLDRLYTDYCAKIEEQYNAGEIMNDIEDVFNEETISVYTWGKVIKQVPAIMTSLGILGTFVGLLIGLRDVNFGTVDKALDSVSVLLSGINVAFYTSIAGIILSVLFNIMYGVIQNILIREMNLFTQSYHRHAIPSVEEQERHKTKKDSQKILNVLSKLPKQSVTAVSSQNQSAGQGGMESVLLPQIMEGLENHEFTYYVQPKYDLNTKKVIGAEALARWVRPSFGIIPPSVFIPVLEHNGFITKLDQYLWDGLLTKIKAELDKGIRPVPIGINITKTDILALNVPEVLHELLEKHQVPPTYITAEIAASAYIHAKDLAMETESQLRQNGIRVIIDGFDKDMIGIEISNGNDEFMADAVKVDIRSMDKSSYKSQIADIMGYTNSRGIQTEASGIESPEDMMFLRRSGCTCGQGFYLSEPVAFDVYEKLLTGKTRP